MKHYLEKHHRLLGLIGALIAFLLAVIYLEVTPEKSAYTGVVQGSIITYGHSLCWFLLCGASSLWAVMGKNKWSVFLAYAALIIYVIFIMILLVGKSA